MDEPTTPKPQRGGARAGAGRKPNAVRAEFETLLETNWTVSDREAAVKKLAELATAGDMDAIKLLLAYAYGKPVDRKEIIADVSAYIVDIDAE